jgi:long-chain acyl-CoA synthetase
MSLGKNENQHEPRIPLFEGEPNTLGELFLLTGKNKPRPDILNYREDGVWKPISTNELISRAENIALGLYSLGVKKGDRVAILAGNSPDWTITDAGCQFAGVIDVPIYTTLNPDSVKYILNDSGAKILFLQDRKMLLNLEAIIPDCSSIEKIVLFKGDVAGDENTISLSELENQGNSLKSSEPELIASLQSNVKSNDIATLIYTSGTTGEPKGVMLTHGNLVSNTIDASGEFVFTPNDKPLSVLPLSHVFERTGMYLYILNGMAVHYAESIDKVADNLREVKPTIFVGVPRIFEKVYAKAKLTASQSSPLREKIFDWAIAVAKEYALQLETKQAIPAMLAVKHTIADRIVFSKFREFFGGNLRACITGGAALSNDIFLIFTGAGVSIMQGYGLTETSPVITSNTPKNVKLGTVGRPIRNVKIRIAADGEIEASGPNIMLGYYNKPEATTETFTTDGWFKTGDIGMIDDEGYLKITDRKKELFKTSGGKYIAPSPIEQLIKGSRFVNQVVLVGNDRKFAAALIVPNFEQLASYAKSIELLINSNIDFCKHPKIVELIETEVDNLTQSLSNFEKVKKIALLENELTVETGELTPTLKVKRRVVNEKYADLIDEIYAQAEKEKPAK